MEDISKYLKIYVYTHTHPMKTSLISFFISMIICKK